MEVNNYVVRLQDISPISINNKNDFSTIIDTKVLINKQAISIHNRVINHPTKYTKNTLQFILHKEKSIMQAHVYNEAGELLRQFTVEEAISRAHHLDNVSG